MKMLKNFKNLSEKNKIILKNTVGAFVIKGASLFISLFTMPAYIRFFNDEISLGVWFTILSLLTWILNFDLGIGNGLRNHLSKSIAKNDDEESKKLISSAYASVGLLSVFISVIFFALAGFINWNIVLNIDSNIVSKEALLTTVLIVFGGIMLQFFLRLISSILYSMQKSSVNNLLSLCTSVITFLSVVLLPSSNNNVNMIRMAIIHALAVLIPLIIVTILVFKTKRMRHLAPRIKHFSSSHAKKVLSLGGTFFFVQIAYMVIMNTNEYLITAFYDPSGVVEYNIYHKLFSLGSTVFVLAITPIWSAVTKAIAEKDVAWVKKIFKMLCLLGILATLCEFLIVPFLQIGINLWLGEDAIQTNIVYGLAFAAFGSLMIWNSILSTIANGVGALKTQTVCFTIGAIAKVPIAFLLVLATNSWMGVLLANVLSMLIYCVVEPFTIRKTLNKI